MQAVAFIFLAIGVLTIRRLIVANNSKELNNKMLALHCCAFALYLLAGAVIYYRTIIGIVSGDSAINKIIHWATVSLVIYFTMMVALLVILDSMSKVTTHESTPQTEITETLQANDMETTRTLSMYEHLERRKGSKDTLDSEADDDRIITQFLLDK